MRTIVTGAAGFIGSHLCERLLAEGHHVIGIDNLSVGRLSNLDSCIKHQQFSFVQRDIETYGDHIDELFKGVDTVFHLAARADIVPSIVDPIEYHRTNVSGTVEVLEASRKSRVSKFLYSASSSCYGIATEYPTPETARKRPEYPYALTKYLGEQCVMHWHKVYGLPAISLRLFNVFGPRARTSGTYGAVFGVFLKQILENKPLTVVGDGSQTRDFTYVDDVVDAFIMAAKSDAHGEVFNVGSGWTYSINDLVRLLGVSCVEFIPERPGEPKTTWGDTRKISQRLGWLPNNSFEDGVKKLLSHIDDFKNAPLWDKDSIAKATKEWFEHLGEKT